MKSEKTKKDLAYYITMFKIKGHSTWRLYASQMVDGFKNDKNMQAEVTDTMAYRIDRKTGEIKTL